MTNATEARIHVGFIGSGDAVTKPSIHRDTVAADHGLVAFDTRRFGYLRGTGEKSDGERDPEMLAAMSNLARIRGKQNRWNEAKEICLQVLEMRRVVRGQGPPSTVIVMSHLAELYKRRERVSLHQHCRHMKINAIIWS